jgi:hypothetical protein
MIDCDSACTWSDNEAWLLCSVLMVNEPAASQVLTSSKNTSPPPRISDTSTTNGALEGRLRGATTRSGVRARGIGCPVCPG